MLEPAGNYNGGGSKLEFKVERLESNNVITDGPDTNFFNRRSFIANVTLEPIAALVLSTFCSSEPGDGERNQSIGGAMRLNFLKFTLDAEYITALTREKGENETQNKESAGIVGLAYDLLDALQLATRYEVFRDDTRGDQDDVLDYRFVAGFTYFIYRSRRHFCEYRYPHGRRK